MSACVRFSNDTSLGTDGFILNPFNGNTIEVYDQQTSEYVGTTVPNSGLSGIVSSCYINDMATQSMPYNIVHYAFLKMNSSGSLYINWLPTNLAGTQLSPSGYQQDIHTGEGHLIGMAIRLHGSEIQGGASSQLLISYYNRGQCSFSTTPIGTVSSGGGWHLVGSPVQLLIWEDDWPLTVAQLNLTGTTINSSMQASIFCSNQSGVISQVYGAATNAVPGNPYMATLCFPGSPIVPGFYSYQVALQVNVGQVTLGAALNSTLIVHGKF